MLEKLFGRKPPLAGAPPVRRQKTYSAESGYVYQYYYEGYRSFGSGAERGIEYVFDVSADRKTSTAVSVFLAEASLVPWHGRHGRELAAVERYAVAKLALFHAFDERAHPRLMKQPVRVRAADVEGILAALDIE